MFMEDLIIQVADQFSWTLPKEDQKFINSVSYRARDKTALTTRQGYAVKRVLAKNVEPLSEYVKDIASLLETLEWERKLVPSQRVKAEARYLGGNLVALRTSTSPAYREAIKSMKGFYAYGMGVNIVAVTKQSILDKLITLLGEQNFDIDSELETYLSDAMFCKGDKPSVAVDGNMVGVKIPDNTVFAEFCHQVLGLEE